MNLKVRSCNLDELKLGDGILVLLETMREDNREWIRVRSDRGLRLFDITHPIVTFLNFEVTNLYIEGFIVIKEQYKKIHLALT